MAGQQECRLVYRSQFVQNLFAQTPAIASIKTVYKHFVHLFVFGGQYVKLSQLVQRCIKIGLHLPSEKSIAKIIADAILLGLADRTSTGHKPEAMFLDMCLGIEFNHDIDLTFSNTNICTFKSHHIYM